MKRRTHRRVHCTRCGTRAKLERFRGEYLCRDCLIDYTPPRVEDFARTGETNLAACAELWSEIGWGWGVIGAAEDDGDRD